MEWRPEMVHRFEFGQQEPGESAHPNSCIRPGTSCPRCGGRFLFGPLLEIPDREFPDGIIDA
jgi:hypothetical protein